MIFRVAAALFVLSTSLGLAAGAGERKTVGSWSVETSENDFSDARTVVAVNTTEEDRSALLTARCMEGESSLLMFPLTQRIAPNEILVVKLRFDRSDIISLDAMSWDTEKPAVETRLSSVNWRAMADAKQIAVRIEKSGGGFANYRFKGERSKEALGAMFKECKI